MAKKANKEDQLDLPETVDPLAKAKDELQKANEIIASLQSENVKLLEQNEKLGEVATAGLESTLKSTDTLTRKDVIKAMLPQIRRQYAKTDAQSLKKSIDEVCEVFGI